MSDSDFSDVVEENNLINSKEIHRFELKSSTWRILPLFNAIGALYSYSCQIYISVLYYSIPFIRFLDNSDGKDYISILLIIFFLSAIVSSIGVWYTNKSLFETRKPLSKYKIYCYSVWLFCIVLLFPLSLVLNYWHYIKPPEYLSVINFYMIIYIQIKSIMNLFHSVFSLY